MINFDINVTQFVRQGEEFDAKLKDKMQSIISRIDQGEQPSSPGIKKALKEYNIEGLRDFLEGVFKKCVFCEAYGNHEIEHYRPKSDVRDLAGKKTVAVTDQEGKRHPGYYWLALELTNFLWVCRECNAGKGAKHTKFPIQGQRVFKHTAEAKDRRIDSIALKDQEKPLLLNPLIHSPQNHVRVDYNGKLVPVNSSEKGRVSIIVCNLNRYGLRIKKRKKIIDDICRKLTRQLYSLKKFLSAQNKKITDYQEKEKLLDLSFGEVFFHIRENKAPNAEFSRVYHCLNENFQFILDSNIYTKNISQKDKSIILEAFQMFA